MLVGVLGLLLIDMGFRVNSCEVSHFTEAPFKNVLKIFVTQLANSRYEMYFRMGALLIHMLYYEIVKQTSCYGISKINNSRC